MTDTESALDRIIAANDAQRKQSRQQQTQNQPTTQIPDAPEIQFDTQKNQFYKIWADTKLSKEQKLAAFTKAMTYDENKNKADNKATQDELAEFMSYLGRTRTLLSREMVKNEDPELIALLDKIFDKLNTKIRDYEKSMDPQDKILSAFYTLRNAKEGNIQYAMLDELKTDDEAAAAKEAAITKEQGELNELDLEITKTVREIAEKEAKVKDLNSPLSFKKKFLVFGDLRDKPKKELDETNGQLDKQKTTLSAAQTIQQQKQSDLQSLIDTPTATTKYASYAAEKEIIKEMLAKPLAEHIEDTKKILKSLVEFIDENMAGGDELLGKLKKQETNIEGHETEHEKLRKITAMLAQASGEAAKTNQAISEKYETAPEGELAVNEDDRMDKLRAVQGYLKKSRMNEVDMVAAMRSLITEGTGISERISNIETLQRQVNTQATTSLASVAAGIATSVSNFSQATATETFQATESATQKIREKTELQNQSAAIQQANAFSEEAQKMQQDIQKMDDDFKVMNAIGEIRREGLGSLKENLAMLKTRIDEMRKNIDHNESLEAHIDVQDAKGALAGKFDRSAQPGMNDNTPVTATRDTPKTSTGLPTL
jgi:hypothetical protein